MPLMAASVRVRAAVQEHFRQVEVAVDGGQHQRRGVVADLRLVDVHAGVEERRGRLDIALARGKEKRREAAVRVHQLVAGEVPVHARHAGGSRRSRVDAVVPPGRVAAVPSAATFHRTGFAAGLLRRLGMPNSTPLNLVRSTTFRSSGSEVAEIRAGLAQRRHHRRMIRRRGKHRRREPAHHLARVQVHLALRDRLHRGHITRRRRKHQHRGAVVGGGLRIGAARQQRFHHRAMTLARRQHQRRVAVDARGRARVGAGPQQERGERLVAVHRRPVERRHAVALRGVHVRAPLDQRHHRRGVAALGGIGHRHVPRGQHRRAKDDGDDS